METTMLGADMRLEGRLLVETYGLALALDDGTIWYPDFKFRVHRFIGQRVVVRGIRTAFDRIDARSIDALEG